MSSNSQKSSGKSYLMRGIPAKCVCGGDVKIFTSTTQENPGRPFYRCVTKTNDHLFKWVEESVLEEVEDALPKFGNLESEVYNLKAEVEFMKDMMQELRAEIMGCKSKIWKFHIVLGTCFVSTAVIAYLLYRHK